MGTGKGKLDGGILLNGFRFATNVINNTKNIGINNSKNVVLSSQYNYKTKNSKGNTITVTREISGTTNIINSNCIHVYTCEFAKEVNFTNCYYVKTDRIGNDCFSNKFTGGLQMRNTRNFILNECQISTKLNISKDKSETFNGLFTVTNTYVNNVSIDNMNYFTIKKYCVRTNSKPYDLSNCSRYTNGSRKIVKTELKDSHTHSS